MGGRREENQGPPPEGQVIQAERWAGGLVGGARQEAGPGLGEGAFARCPQGRGGARPLPCRWLQPLPAALRTQSR